uniref:protein lin-9 homolog n=1 Tax=Ciona intestinalis TaxID=7719 RepID=UPI000224AC5E|nr:protein lin-9 homolog [Ciona intestinalis]|eukprot:XP_004225686.3 protein lin-9 homolog [Ciona intestinalis]
MDIRVSGSQTVYNDKAAARVVGARLRNLLKLPKAHKMCIFEWFYSHLDTALLKGDNDFCMCLKESFPGLKTRNLTRAHWCKIRRLMGKPRRCSAAFFEEERAALNNKRDRIRQLQQSKIGRENTDAWCDLPREVPMPLVVGTNVTGHLHGSHDGLFTGQIDAVDILNSSYRVIFDRQNIGIRTVRDIDVSSSEPQETINLLSLMENKRHIPRSSSKFSMMHLDPDSTLQSPSSEHDPILGRSPLRSKLLGSLNENGGTIGGFPVQLLKSIARLSKILTIKRDKIHKLGEMNSQAEKANSYGEALSLEFQRKYATIVLDLERINKDLNELLVSVQKFCSELYPEQSSPNDQVAQIRQLCLTRAEEMVRTKNVGDDVAAGSKRAIKNHAMTDLITHLTALMMQVKYFKENIGNSIEYKSLIDALKEIKLKISSENLDSFRNNVEIHIVHVKSGMDQSELGTPSFS